MTRLVWRIPELPDMCLSTNGRSSMHRMKLARLVREENERWYFLLINSAQLHGGAHRSGMDTIIPFERGRLSFHITFPRRDHQLDDDNLEGALKVIRDTLQVATKRAPNRWQLGVIVDDDPKHLEPVSVTSEVIPGVNETRIEVEAVCEK